MCCRTGYTRYILIIVLHTLLFIPSTSTYPITATLAFLLEMWTQIGYKIGQIQIHISRGSLYYSVRANTKYVLTSRTLNNPQTSNNFWESSDC